MILLLVVVMLVLVLVGCNSNSVPQPTVTVKATLKYNQKEMPLYNGNSYSDEVGVNCSWEGYSYQNMDKIAENGDQR
jgi:hypothetical protein